MTRHRVIRMSIHEWSWCHDAWSAKLLRSVCSLSTPSSSQHEPAHEQLLGTGARSHQDSGLGPKKR